MIWSSLLTVSPLASTVFCSLMAASLAFLSWRAWAVILTSATIMPRITIAKTNQCFGMMSPSSAFFARSLFFLRTFSEAGTELEGKAEYCFETDWKRSASCSPSSPR